MKDGVQRAFGGGTGVALEGAVGGVRECEPGVRRPTRRRDLVELLVGYGLILLVIWTPRPWQGWIYCVAAIFLVAVTWRSFESAGAMGLRTTNLLRSAWVVGIAVMVAGVAVMVASRMDTLLHPGGVKEFVARYWGYALWAFAQQILLQDFFLQRMLRLTGRPGAAVAAATGVFALAHLPNPILTGVTVVWGALACVVFLRYRNLYSLGLAHAILGIALAVTVPGPVIRNMRVGLGYVRYHPHGARVGRQRSQMDHRVSTQAWVKAEAATRRS